MKELEKLESTILYLTKDLNKYKNEVKSLNVVIKNLRDINSANTYADFRDKRNHIVSLVAAIECGPNSLVPNEHIVKRAIALYDEINKQLKGGKNENYKS